jgi:hypothetical protein
MPKAFYLLGYNFTVPADKRREPELYKRARMSAKWSPNGMGVIAIENDDIHSSPGLFGGLTLTLAAMGQPAIGRIAMLHIGTRHGTGRDVLDSIVRPGEIQSAEFVDDLRSTIEALRTLGCRRYGVAVEELLSTPGWQDEGCRRLGNQIVKMIDNTPGWERTRASGKTRGPQSKARGALETFGDGRPRN